MGPYVGDPTTLLGAFFNANHDLALRLDAPGGQYLFMDFSAPTGEPVCAATRSCRRVGAYAFTTVQTLNTMPESGVNPVDAADNPLPNGLLDIPINTQSNARMKINFPDPVRAAAAVDRALQPEGVPGVHLCDRAPYQRQLVDRDDVSVGHRQACFVGQPHRGGRRRHVRHAFPVHREPALGVGRADTHTRSRNRAHDDGAGGVAFITRGRRQSAGAHPHSVAIRADGRPIRAGSRRGEARSPSCRGIYAEFVLPDGGTLQGVLDSMRIGPRLLLERLVFVDGTHDPVCAAGRAGLTTSPGSFVIRVCPRFIPLFVHNPPLSAILILHESLHVLGLAEDRPTSATITHKVEWQCWNNGNTKGR